MDMSRMRVVSLALAGLIGCGEAVDPQQQLEEDVAEFDALKAKLEEKRSVFLNGPAQDFKTTGNTLFWIEAGVVKPDLHSYDAETKQMTRYKFPPYYTGPSNPNPIDGLNYHASPTMIASMNEPTGARAYAVGSEEQLVGELALPAPPMGQKWWAYSVDANMIYVVIIDPTDGKHHLKRWSPGDAEMTEVLALDDLIAPNEMGNFIDFAVSGSTLIWDESYRIWMAELTDTKAKWVRNERQVDLADFQKGSVVYSEDSTFWRYDAASDSRENLTEKILGAYEMNKTFTKSHHPTLNTTWTMRAGFLFYEGNDGIFLYNIEANTVQPMLLSGRDNSVVYRRPAALVNGTIFVKGLESTSGAVGADGPTFMFVP